MNGRLFFEASSHRANVPGPWRTTPGSGEAGLDAPQREGGAALWGVLDRRRSVRKFSDRPLDRATVSQLLWAHNGRSGRFRTAPSAGAMYPLTTYVLVFRVDGIDPGLYRYDTEGHRLELTATGITPSDFSRACLDQAVCRRAALALVWAARPDRAVRYGERAFRYMLLDAGHIGQNVHLACTAMALGSCMIGAFHDDLLADLIGVDGLAEFVVYAAAVGWPEPQPCAGTTGRWREVTE